MLAVNSGGPLESVVEGAARMWSGAGVSVSRRGDGLLAAAGAHGGGWKLWGLWGSTFRVPMCWTWPSGCHGQAWAECVARLLRDAALRRRCGQAGRLRARDRFSLEAGRGGARGRCGGGFRADLGPGRAPAEPVKRARGGA